MKKRIVAAVLSLLLVASSVPMAEFASFIPVTDINASAYGEAVTVKNDAGEEFEIGYSQGTDTKGRAYLKISIPTGFFENKSEVKIDTSSIRTALLKQGVTSEGTDYVELSYNFAYRTGNTFYHSLLSSVKFTDNFITKIGDNMFQGHTNLQTVDLGKSIKYIGNNAFSSCTNFVGSTSNNTANLQNIVEIGDNAFNNCKTLASAKLSSSLKSIGVNAFSGNTKFTNITIPKSVESIGKNAFNNDTALDNIKFESGSKLEMLDDGVFSGCTALKKVYVGNTENTLPSRLVTVGKDLFKNCTSLQKFTIPYALEEVSESMFNSCTSLKTVKFEADSQCVNIGMQAFQKCTAIETMELPDSVRTIDPAAFSTCTKLSKLILPDELRAFNPAMSNTATFENCPVLSMAPKSKAKSLKSNQIIIPSKVTHITANCFSGCTGITDVVMPNIKTIAGAAFQNCKSLPKITIPDAVTTIREATFNGCTSLKTVVYSKKLQEFEQQAFKNCTALQTATPSDAKVMKNTVQIPKTCGAAQKEAFQNCSSIKYINIIGGASSQFATVGESAFSGCSSLEGSTTDGTSSQELKFPRLVTVIQQKAFEKCTSLKTIQFEGKVTSLGDYVFQDCSSLKKVTMNPTITQIGKSGFKNCTSLTNLPVTTTGASALTQLERIDEETFSGCTSLKNVDVSAAKKFTSIERSAFYGCKNLTKFILPANGKLTNIGNYAFQNCTALTTINSNSSAKKTEFPKSIVSIGDSAFASTGLKDITLHKPNDKNAYNTIGENAFNRCEQLTNVDFSDSNLTTLSKGIFAYDTELKSVKLPNAMQTFSESAFDDCTSLSTINSTTKGTANLPTKLKTIGAYAFRNTHNISKIIIPAATDNIDMSAFNSSLSYKQEDIDSGKYNPLKEFSVNSKNQNYKSTNGVLYNKKVTDMLRYPRMKDGKKFTVPDTVTVLKEAAMGSNNKLEYVTIGPNVQKIEKNAFYNMESLKAVDFKKNTSVYFDPNAFSNFSGSRKIVFYAARGSTAEYYANQHSSFITFVDNDMMAANLSIKQGDYICISTYTGRFQLEAVLTTKTGVLTNDVITWTSSDPEIASVDNNGFVSPRKAGIVKITATTANGLTKTVTVNIGNEIERLAGDNRYQTAADISTKMYKQADTVVIATGLDFHDAMVAVPLATAYDAPLLLAANNSKAMEPMLKELKRLKTKNVIIVSTNGALNDKVKTALSGYKKTLIEGKTCFDTAAKVAKALQTKTKKAPETIFFATDGAFADALSVSPVAAVLGSPIIYLKKDGSLDSATKNYLASIKGKVKKAYVIGGDGVISNNMMKTVASTIGLKYGATISRLAGQTRYETCVAVNNQFANVLTGPSLGLATGQDFPDALAGGVFAASTKSALFLVNTGFKTPKLLDFQTDYLKDKKAKRFFVFGGTGVLSDAAAEQVRTTSR